jgi:uncharacterized protein YerC
MSKPQDDKNVSVPPALLAELLTDSEVRMVKQRLMILRLLSEGHTVRSIAEQVGVGTDTVVRMARKIESNPALQLAFEKHLTPAAKSSSKWVFGQVGTEEKL